MTPKYQTIGSIMDELSELRKVRTLAGELIAILETIEATDDGREFHPTTITSCRCMTSKRIGEICAELKAATMPNDSREPRNERTPDGK